MSRWIAAAFFVSLTAHAAENSGGFTLKETDLKDEQSIVLQEGDSCYAIAYPHSPAETFSCTEPTPITYELRDCKTGEKKERGQANAIISCEGKHTYHVHFRTKEGTVTANLRAKKVPRGRLGTVTTYTVKSVEKNSKYAVNLPEPKLLDLEGKTPEEAPIEFKFSGFMTMEFEHTARYGYDVGTSTTTAAPNFSNNVDRPRRKTGSLFSNLNFSLRKDRTSIESILEIGEIYFGDSATGGAQGARASNLLEVRNLYLEHKLSDNLRAKAGIITSATDPRGFVYSDHTAAVHAAYETALVNTVLWYGTAQKSRPAATNYLHDSFFSAQFNLNSFFGVKNTLYYAVRNQANASLAQDLGDGTFATLTGRGQNHWAGGTFSYSHDPLTLDATFIGNWNRFAAPGLASNTQFGYLADGKISAGFWDSKINVGLEGLATPGAKNSSNGGNKVLGRRGSFSSPVGASYLLNVATNDGVDDAPGTPKQSIIGDLNLDEGLRILVGSVGWSINKTWSTYFRAGHITTAAESAQRSREYGHELDFGGAYQLTPSATLSLDYGYFKPGAFFAKRSPAELASVKYKFSF